MWKSTYEVRLIRFEGVPSYTSCEIFLNKNLMETVTPSSLEKTIAINTNGKYQLIVKGDSSLSVSFSVNLFEDDGMMWLPLYNRTKIMFFIVI